jgi:hypothetical protein
MDVSANPPVSKAPLDAARSAVEDVSRNLSAMNADNE